MCALPVPLPQDHNDDLHLQPKPARKAKKSFCLAVIVVSERLPLHTTWLDPWACMQATCSKQGTSYSPKHQDPMQHFNQAGPLWKVRWSQSNQKVHSSLPKDTGCSMLHPGRPVATSMLALE